MNKLYRVYYGDEKEIEVLCEPDEYENMKTAFDILNMNYSCEIVEDVMYRIIWNNEEKGCCEHIWLTDEDEYIDILSKFSEANIEYDAKIYN
jgi:hypothetical protein